MKTAQSNWFPEQTNFPTVPQLINIPPKGQGLESIGKNAVQNHLYLDGETARNKPRDIQTMILDSFMKHTLWSLHRPSNDRYRIKWLGFFFSFFYKGKGLGIRINMPDGRVEMVSIAARGEGERDRSFGNQLAGFLTPTLKW